MKSVIFFGIIGLQACLFFILPAFGTSVFLSPDETATAVSARQFGAQGNMRLAAQAPTWLHPRSFVSQGSALVPVGFLGLPLILGFVWRLFGEWGLSLFTPLLVLSVVYPLWRFAKIFGRAGQAVTVMSWLSFPSVILYTNRGLFPNLPAVCFALWGVYFILTGRKIVRSYLMIGAGICLGLALAIRPIEAVWIVPWLVWAWRSRQEENRPDSVATRSRLTWFFIGLIAVLSIAACVAWKTYGVWFQIGYLLRDVKATQIVSMSPPTQVFRLAHVWPFGFHPRNIWFHVKAYIVDFLGPWSILAVLACLIYWRRYQTSDQSRRSLMVHPVILLVLWTFFVLLLLYGENILQDHVGLNIVSSGNSFLRYFLPMAPLFALAAGAVAAWFRRRMSWKRSIGFIGVLSLSLIIFGTWTALRRDDEGLLSAVQDVRSYQGIRRMAQTYLPAETTIVSERSDKIFVPTFRAVSPLPAMTDVIALSRQSGAPVALFSSTLDTSHQRSWQDAGLSLTPVFTLEEKHQTMYVVRYVQ